MLDKNKLMDALRIVRVTLQQKKTEEEVFETCMSEISRMDQVAADYVGHVLGELNEAGLEGAQLDATVRSLLVTTFTLVKAYKLTLETENPLTSTTQLETGKVIPHPLDRFGLNG